MAEVWLSIIGLGEDGLAGLADASRAAIDAAEVIFGGPRHLALVNAADRGRAWPVPFDVAPVLALRGRRVVVLASGDPFWFGAGGSLSAHLVAGEWVAHPAPSTFALAAARLGWRIESVDCLGLHAAPYARLRGVLAEGSRAICLLRDGKAPAELAEWLVGAGFGASDLTVLQALGGPRARIATTTAAGFDVTGITAPVAVAIVAKGNGLPRSGGLPDDMFQSDGQITKRPVRALTLSALAPRRGETLWDLGAGSGSISVEWCLAGGFAHAVEARPERAANIVANAGWFGIDHRLTVHQAAWGDALASLPRPDAVFVGGGADADLMARLWSALPAGVRVVMNAVTLESESLLYGLHAAHGGSLARYDIAQAGTLGRMRDWQAARPVVQWSVVR
ncbi:precorrin-6y C5,15-methyltransferase (decarboxylating) subunit CbiE [Paragemmobacter straminiformis]|uniref:Precorrin-6y C5,15-methyltransferase (Decarboxylating) subunit CbiE n=1 Tax=Paragemmobacter straminiformis TaxID=2045119 RepID=A0A842I3S6_9RHOB|nr:precorrin-6y C5,15-methyltransferase (decarboxylating) subunit CbiE [Gemmobacter straminiformis]MBC2834309.1 precorrin-6y C5,15-methyltransferase (decarboxylating) subunit CbiE [Gemmobacter straminiformis]